MDSVVRKIEDVFHKASFRVSVRGVLENYSNRTYYSALDRTMDKEIIIKLNASGHLFYRYRETGIRADTTIPYNPYEYVGRITSLN